MFSSFPQFTVEVNKHVSTEPRIQPSVQNQKAYKQTKKKALSEKLTDFFFHFSSKKRFHFYK